jgi:subfamily B ATP-binding cassette protein MsbA
MQPLMEIVAVSASLIFLVFAYSRGVTVTEMVAILAPAILAYRPVKDLTKVVNHLQKSLAAADRYFEIMDTDTSLKEKENPVELEDFRDAIEFRNVSFSYEEGHPILSGVSFRIPRGKMVAVVGETGSGKTTIASLLARFYDVSEGQVLIDGVDVRDYSIRSLRRNVGIVTQDPILFNDTIAENIAYGCAGASREEIVDAAKKANAHSFITGGGHPGGYDEIVGEKGFKLSGGEKQRVAIARAILKNPPILILDEATSALDTVTEKLVQEALNNVMSNRTVFAIAHRLSTIRSADLILVLEKGVVQEAGTHEELLAKNGKYRKLHDTQFSM